MISELHSTGWKSAQVDAIIKLGEKLALEGKTRLNIRAKTMLELEGLVQGFSEHGIYVARRTNLLELAINLVDRFDPEDEKKKKLAAIEDLSVEGHFAGAAIVETQPDADELEVREAFGAWLRGDHDDLVIEVTLPGRKSRLIKKPPETDWRAGNLAALLKLVEFQRSEFVEVLEIPVVSRGDALILSDGLYSHGLSSSVRRLDGGGPVELVINLAPELPDEDQQTEDAGESSMA